MPKKIVIFMISLLLILTITLPAFADPIITLDYEDIEGKILERNPIVKDNNQTYKDSLATKNTSTATIDSLISQWDSIYGEYTDNLDPELEGYNAAIGYLLNAQKASLDEQKRSLTKYNVTDPLVNIEKANFTIAWNMEKLYLTYHDNLQQLEDYNAKRALAEKKVQITKLQRDLGLITEISFLEAERDFSSLESVVALLDEANKTIIKQFNINLEQELDTPLELGDIPEITAQNISGIDPDQDYESVKSRSYDVRLDENSADSQKKFKNNFYNAYQNMLDENKALEIEEKKFVIAENKLKFADIKYKLGMISSIQYEAEKSTYTNQKITTQMAKYDLAEAYYQYQWAKRGMIFSTSSY